MNEASPHPSERRVVAREAVLWRARVRKPLNVTEVEFEICDFSNAGLYLSAKTDEARRFAESAPVGLLIEVLVPDQADEIAVQARGSVTRGSTDGLGVRLRESGRECVSFLRLINAPTLHEQRPSAPALKPDEMQTQILGSLRAYFGKALARYLQTLDQDLFRAAQKARNPTEEGDLLRARKLLETDRDATIERFLSALMRTTPSAPEPAKTAKTGGPMKLIERDELETWLASAELASHTEARYGEQLGELRHLLQAAGERGVDAQVAAQPDRFVQALNSALGSLDLDPRLRPQLYRTFQDQALNGLTELFGEVSELLGRGGITNTQAATPVRNERAPTNASDAPPLPARSESATTPQRALDYSAQAPSSSARVSEAFQSALRLLSRSTPSAPSTLLPSQQLPDDELIQELTRLIAEESHSGSGRQFDELALRFELTDQPDRKALNTNQVEALDLLKRLRESVHSEGLLPDAFFRWYQMLEPRLLADRLKLSDPTPAAMRWRDVLGALEFAAQTLRGRTDPSALEQVAKVETLVLELSQGQPGDEQPFILADEMLTQMFGRQIKAAKASEARVAEACSGQQKLNDARRMVERELGAAFGGRRIARSLQALIDESLRDLLVLKAVQLGIDNPLWQEAFAALRELNTALITQHSNPSVRRTGQAAFERLRFQLDQLAGDPKTQSALAGQIETELTRGGAELEMFAPHPISEPPRMAPDEAKKRLLLMDLGDWIGFANEDMEVRPAKLVWRAPDLSRFVFVGQAGKKSHDIGATELLDRLDSGQAQVLEDWHLSIADRAWRRVVEDLHNELAHLATHDELTGLLNRREFERLLTINLSAATDALGSGGLMLIGLDGFARINANLSWEAGDYALKAVAEALVTAAPAQSLIGRLDGDHFALWIPKIDLAQTTQHAEKLLRAVRTARVDRQGTVMSLTASAGVVAPLLAGAQQALKEVSIALRRAKEEGPDRVAHADDSQSNQDSLLDAYQWLERLERALASDKLTLFAQPIRDLSAPPQSDVGHLEVLARLVDGNSFVLPEMFLPVAERFNRMGAIDRHVVRELMTQLGKNRAAFDRIKIVALNISAKSLTDASFIDFLIEQSSAARIDPKKLCIEVTETVAIRDLSLAKVFMLRLKAHGFMLALDDFGSGWASYQYLKHLPVDFIKIDGAFIRDLAHSEQDFAMVRSINDLAHVLGKKTVGEHVGDEATLAQVRELKLDFGQGFALGRPEPLSDFLARLTG